MTFSINTRRVIFSVLWIIIISFVVSLALVFLITANVASISLFSASWFQIVETILIAVVGVVVGLVWESSTRTRYMEKIANRPPPSERAKKTYRTILVLAGVAGAIYILSNVVVVYEAMASGITIPISSVQQTDIFIGIARYLILALALIWLFAEPKKENALSTTADIKRYFLWGAIFCFIMAGVNLFGLSMFKVSDATATTIPVSGVVAVNSSTAQPNNPAGTIPSSSSPWTTYTFPKNFSIEYPSTWTVANSSSIGVVLSSSPTIETFNGVCKISASADPNSQKLTLDQFVAMNLGDIKTTTTTATLKGLPALTASYTTTDEPYIATVINERTWALLPNSSIADLQLSCGSDVVDSGTSVFESVLATFKVL